MPKRSRLPKSGNAGKKRRLGSLKFGSYYALESFLAGKGASHVLYDIEEMEMRGSKRFGYRVSRQEVQERILNWWNTITEKPNILSQRPSYVVTYLLREAIKKLE